MTKHLHVRHEVADYRQWKSQFYAHEKKHHSHSIKYLHVLCNKANQNNMSDVAKVKDVSSEHPR